MYQADIKTVDAFCTSLLRENTHLLAREGDSRALTPDFRVLDDNEAQLIRQRVLSRTLEDFYDQLDEGRGLLADTLGAGRDDSRLAALVLELYDKVQSHADPAGWLAENRTVWGGWEGGFDDTPYAAELLAAIRRKGAHWGALLRSASARTEGDEALYRGYGEKFLQVSVAFDALAQVQTWEAARQTEAAVAFPRLSTPKGRKDEPGIAALKQVWERCKAEEKKLAGLLSVSEEEAMEDLTAVAPAMVALLELTEDFAERYRQEKLRLNAADFSDQEHLALGLLVGSGGAPTELGEQVAARYREILVDEYQDTNEIQNAIFRAVSKNGQNIFTVGDVKQSIYRFRLADPTIFLGKYNRFKSWQEAADGEERKILLSRNFRSRRENLIALSQHAEKFESNGYRGLFAFVTQLRRLLEQDQAPATRGPAEAAGVRLMSIHKSKGLEFPIVILADLDHAFSRQDFDTPVLVHPDMGLGPKRIDLERKIQYPTLARLAIQEKLRRENLAEEQRILYVAMTRPKEKLILVDALYNATGRLQKLAAVAACPVLPETVAEGRTLGDWVLLPLLCRPEAAPLRAMAETEIDQLYIGEDRSWQVFLHDSEDYRERPARPQATAEETGETALFDPELLSFIYPYQRETALPAKVTATQLKGRPADQEIAEYAAHTPYLRPLSQPNFRRERQGLTPAERGTATHLVLQYLDFSNVDVAGQIEALRQRSLLTDQQAAAVETAPLERFLRSPLAEEIRKSRSVLREYRFTLLMDARDYDPAAAAGEEILLQGVVDCCFETADGLTVVDFKTDRVFSALEVRQRAEHYRPQLEAYSRALERVLEKKVVRRALYFLAAGETMEI